MSTTPRILRRAITRACYTASIMQALRARVRNGRLVLDEPTTLSEGSEVELVPIDEMDDEERAELDRSLRASIAEANAGDVVDADEFFAQLRASR